jgi:SAM-dependent methyltransferase
MQPYTNEFFKEQRIASSASASRVAPIIISLLRPKSVIDVGCGIGAWLSEFRARGIEDFIGVDGDYVDRDQLLIPKAKFIAHDLEVPFYFPRMFDLALSLEVAEHLPESHASEFVEGLCRLAPVVVFSAAVPGQGGVNHTNEQWQDYWASKFRSRGYLALDSLRPRIWHDPEVLWYYRQNMIIFVQESQLNQDPSLRDELQSRAQNTLRIVHPDMYTGLLLHSSPDIISLRRAAVILSHSISGAIRRKMISIFGNRTARARGT